MEKGKRRKLSTEDFDKALKYKNFEVASPKTCHFRKYFRKFCKSYSLFTVFLRRISFRFVSPVAAVEKYFLAKKKKLN